MKYYLKMEIKESYPNLSFVEFCQMKFFYNNIQITTDENNLLYPSKTTNIAGWYCKNIMNNSLGISYPSPNYVLFELPTKFDKFTFRNGDLDGSQIKKVEYYILQSETIPNRTDIGWKFQGLYEYQQVTETKTVLVSFYNVKYLLKDNVDNVKYIDNSNNILNLGTTTPTLQDYVTYGFDDLNKLDNTKINQLSKFKILSYCDDTTVVFKTKISAVPLPQIIKMKQPINITNVDGINSITSTINTSTYGKVKILVSFDNINYYSYNGTDWILVDVNNKDDFNINGMIKEMLNSIPSQQWNDKRGTSNSLYFAYYIEINNISDTANIDKIELNCNLKGKWDNAESKINVGGTIYGDYHYSYESNSLLKIYLYKSGTYKINYPQ